MDTGRVLILDQHSSYAVQACRDLGRLGHEVWALAEPTAPVLRSRFCRRPVVSPPWYATERFLAALEQLIETSAPEAIYLCSEQILEAIVPLLDRSDRWRALLRPPLPLLKLAFSKNEALAAAAAAGVPVPRTVVPSREEDVAAVGETLGFPLVVKGEKGGAAQHVRIVRQRAELLPRYREIVHRERKYCGRPALQEFIAGPTYSVGGLFDRGRPLRVLAHRRLLIYPPDGGHTVKGVTERPPALLESAFAVFAALEYTGLGHVDFIRNDRDGTFRFLEINPRVWGSIGLGRLAGVDFYTPYHALVRGRPIAPDLAYREGIIYRHLSRDLRLLRRRPRRIFGLLRDTLDPRVRSDFAWLDPGPSLPRLWPSGSPRYRP